MPGGLLVAVLLHLFVRRNTTNVWLSDGSRRGRKLRGAGTREEEGNPAIDIGSEHLEQDGSNCATE